MLTSLGGGELTPYGGGTLTSSSNSAGPTRTILVEKPPCGYWVAGSGYPALNGIYEKVVAETVGARMRRRSASASPFLSEEQLQGHSKSAEPDFLLYRHAESKAELKWVDQGWLLRLADGTDCFLQFSINRLMVAGAPGSWQAIDSPDSDPLAEPPDEVVALLDMEVLNDLKASQRAHDERARRARNRFALPSPPPPSSSASPGDGACWWRIVHEPAVHVRAAASTNATSLGWKLAGERVYGLELHDGEWLRVHAPTDAHDEGWMLVDGRKVGLGVLLQRCGATLTLVEDDGEVDWERMVAERGEGERGERGERGDQPQAGQHGEDSGGGGGGGGGSGEIAAGGGNNESHGTAAGLPSAASEATLDATDVVDVGEAEARSDAANGVSDERAPSGRSSRGGGDGHSTARLKSLGDAAFRSGQYALAAERYTDALASAREDAHSHRPRAQAMADAPSGLSAEAILLCNRSAARRLTRQMAGAVSDASEALDLAPTYKKAALRHGIALLESGEYVRARSAFEHFLRLDGGWLAFPWLQRCHTRLAAAIGRGGDPAPEDLYALLDVPCDCSDAVLRQAYKRRSLQCHPDRRGAGDGTASTAAFQRLQTAFEVLRDPQRRSLYDFGEERDWETAARARYFPPKEFRPFVRPSRTPRPSEWDPCD